jgi:hypothetical protein
VLPSILIYFNFFFCNYFQRQSAPKTLQKLIQWSVEYVISYSEKLLNPIQKNFVMCEDEELAVSLKESKDTELKKF